MVFRESLYSLALLVTDAIYPLHFQCYLRFLQPANTPLKTHSLLLSTQDNAGDGSECSDASRLTLLYQLLRNGKAMLCYGSGESGRQILKSEVCCYFFLCRTHKQLREKSSFIVVVLFFFHISVYLTFVTKHFLLSLRLGLLFYILLT